MNVALPDGRVIAFPDSMSQGEVEKAIEGLPAAAATAAAPAAAATTSTPATTATAATPWPSAVRWPVGVAAAGASGLANTLALPGRAESLVDAGADWLAGKMGFKPEQSLSGLITGEAPAFVHHHAFPSPESIASLTNSLGITGNPRLAPQSEAERLAQAGASGLGSALPFILAGPVGPILAAGGSGGLASEGARAFGAPEAVQIAAGVAAGLGTQGVAGMMARGLPHIAADLGTSRSLAEAGIALEDGAKAWRGGGMDAAINAARAPLDASIPSSAVVMPTEVQTRFQDLLSRGGLAADAARNFFNQTARSGGALGTSAKKARAGQPLSWDEARDFRTELGTALRTSNPREKAAIEYLYGGATSDLGTTASIHGAEEAFENFNRVSTAAHQFDAGPIEAILGAKQPADAAQRLLVAGRRGPGDLPALREVMPDAIDELASAHLRLNPTGKAWQQLSPEAQASLVPEAADRAIIAGTYSPAVRGGLVDRSIRDLLIGGVLGRAVGGAVHPLAAEALGTTMGAALPYVASGARQAIRNPLLGTVGGVAGAERPVDSLTLNYP